MPIRVYAKSNPDRLGTIVADAPHGDVLVEWDGEDFHWRIRRDQLVEVNEVAIRCLEILDNLRDAVVLEIETKMNDIRRLMKKEERR